MDQLANLFRFFQIRLFFSHRLHPWLGIALQPWLLPLFRLATSNAPWRIRDLFRHYQDEIQQFQPQIYLWLYEQHVDFWYCLLYTSDAADEGLGVDLGGRRIIK